MKIQLRQGSESHTIKAQSFKRAYLLIQSVGNLPTDNPTDLDIDLSKLNITLELFQGNQLYTSSFNGVAPVAVGSMKQRAFESVSSLDFSASGLACRGQVVQANDGVSNVYLNNVYVPLLWGGYNIKDDDYFKVIVNTNPGFFGGANTSASSFYLVTEESTDVNQIDVNIPYYYPITIDKTNPQFSEHACSEIYLINTAAYTFATQPFQSIEVRSKYVNDRFDNYTLETLSRDLGEGRSFDLGCNEVYNVEPSTLEDVQINLDINTAVVVNGAQWLFVSRTGYSTILLEKAVDRETRINTNKAISRGVSSIRPIIGKPMGRGIRKYKN